MYIELWELLCSGCNIGRLISTTSLIATVGRLTTKFGREDDAPPVPSAA